MQSIDLRPIHHAVFEPVDLEFYQCTVESIGFVDLKDLEFWCELHSLEEFGSDVVHIYAQAGVKESCVIECAALH